MSDDKTLEALNDFLKDEFKFQWDRKSSFESRLAYLTTANLALATLFLVLSEKMGVIVKMASPAVRDWPVAALVLAGLSIIVSVAGSFPSATKMVPASSAQQLFDELLNGQLTHEETLAELIDARIEQLETLQRRNTYRASCSIASYVFFALAALCLAAALAIAFNTP